MGRKLDRGAFKPCWFHSLSICSEPKLRVFFLISKEYEKKLVIVPHGHCGLGPFESVFSSSGKGVQFSLESTSSARQFARPTPRDPKGEVHERALSLK